MYPMSTGPFQERKNELFDEIDLKNPDLIRFAFWLVCLQCRIRLYVMCLFRGSYSHEFYWQEEDMTLPANKSTAFRNHDAIGRSPFIARKRRGSTGSNSDHSVCSLEGAGNGIPAQQLWVITVIHWTYVCYCSQHCQSNLLSGSLINSGNSWTNCKLRTSKWSVRDLHCLTRWINIWLPLDRESGHVYEKKRWRETKYKAY